MLLVFDNLINLSVFSFLSLFDLIFHRTQLLSKLLNVQSKSFVLFLELLALDIVFVVHQSLDIRMQDFDMHSLLSDLSLHRHDQA